ncbi:MAG TPA: sulfatase-like hydrolase/transferase [Thermoanaerobaculia bacterium]|nr:sulfatase-like hydrolase/transferase [Thermoanaerobaculia bacterium]
MKTRLVLCSWISLLAACSRQPEPVSLQGYNVLLVTVDTTRADHIGAYGFREAETPNIDRLAREGVRFDRAISPVPLTLPAHCSILSGLLPLHHAVRNNGTGGLGSDRETIATRLKQAGYRTGAFVGSFVLNRRFGLDRGFDLYDDELDSEIVATNGLEAERTGDIVVDRALSWLQTRDARPFFAWVHLYDPHAPYVPPEPFRSRHLASPYDGEIAFADSQIGRLLAYLDQQKLTDRTIIVIAGDHGEALGEHGELTHGLLLYEPTLHVPLVVRDGIHRGQVASEPVSLIDLAPTITSALDVSWPRADGRPIAALVSTKASKQGGAALYSETEYPRQFGWSGLAALRRGNYKYIASSHPELYDLARDPKETRNLYETERRQLRALIKEMSGLQAGQVKAPQTVMDEETRARLESLGYVGGVALTDGAGPRPDPKEMAPLFRRFEQVIWHMHDQELDVAQKDLESLLAADRNNPVFRSTLARVYRKQGKLDRAIVLYRDTVASTPQDADAWFNLSVALQEAGRQKEAAATVREAIRFDSKRPEAHNTLGISLSAEGDLEGARQEFQRAISLDPTSARAFNNLGNVLRQMNRVSEAEKAYRDSVRLAPKYADPLNGLGTLAVQENRPAEAIPYFERALALAPDYYEAHLNRGIALELTGRRVEAAAEYRRFLLEVKGKEEFSSQRNAATQLLARISARS